MANEKWSQQEKINEELNESIYLCAISGDTELGYTNNIINSSKFASANHTHIDQNFGSSGGTISELTVTGNTTLHSVDIDVCNIDNLFTNHIETDLVISKDSVLSGGGANLSIFTSVSGDSISLINGGNGYGLISKVSGGVGFGVYSVSGNSAEFGFTDMENNTTTASISRYGTITGRNFVSTGTNKSLFNFADISSLRVGGLQVTGTSFFNGQIVASSANLGTLRMSGSILATGSTPYSITMPMARFDNLYVNAGNMTSEDYALYVSGNTHIIGEASINSLEVTNNTGYTRVNNNLSVNGIIYPGSEIESTGDTTGSIVITNGGLGLSGNINGVRIHSRVLGGNTIGRNIWIGGGGNKATGYIEHSEYGRCNTSLGDSSLEENTIGYNNSAIGAFALQMNINGNNNCSFGFNSMSRNTSGSNNTAIGYQSLKDNTIAYNNTAIGYQSLSNNITGGSNTAIGSYSLESNSTGSYNTATGYEALHFNEDGGYNVANGAQALRLNSSGNNNVAIGYNSLYSNTAGGNNTSIGFESMKTNTTGYDNTAIGLSSLYSNKSGNTNTAIGSNSLYSNTVGPFNTANGSSSLYWNTNGGWNTAIGVQSLYFNTTGSENTAVGFSSLYYNTTGNNNTALGNYAGFSTSGDGYNETGSKSVFLGYDTQPLSDGQTNQIVIGYKTIGSGSNTVTIGDDFIDKTILKGSLLIGSTNSGSLNVTGTTNLNGLTTISDLNVTGVANLGSLSFTGGTLTDLNVTNNAVINNLTVTGTYNIGAIEFTGGTIGSMNITGLTTTKDLTVVNSASFNSASFNSASFNSLNSTGTTTLGNVYLNSEGSRLDISSGYYYCLKAENLGMGYANAIYAKSNNEGSTIKVVNGGHGEALTCNSEYGSALIASTYGGTYAAIFGVSNAGGYSMTGNTSINKDGTITSPQIIVSGITLNGANGGTISAPKAVIGSAVTIDATSGGTVTSRIFKFAEELLEIDATQNPNAPLGTMFLSRYFLFIKGGDGWKKIPLVNV